MARIEGIAEQAERDRELKRTELETDRESKLSSEIELEKLKHSFEMKHLELMGQLEVQRASFKTELEKQKSEKLAHARDPKLPYFEESKDKMDSYLSRFKWDKNVWAAYLSALLKGRALDVYDRLSTEDAADHDKLKDALLKNFDMTERGIRKKFRYSRSERSETFIQFSSRLCSYLNKWLTMAKVEKSFEAACDFMARDQFLEACSRELFVHLKPKAFENLDAMAKEPGLFAEARGGVFSCVNKGQRDNNKGAAQGNRSFRTQVISYSSHFVPTFIFNLVISYPVWSFRTHFVPSLVISYLLLLFSRKPFWSFHTYVLLFRTQVISYPKSFRTHFSHFVPTSKLGTN